jgi:hypothetical protein
MSYSSKFRSVKLHIKFVIKISPMLCISIYLYSVFHLYAYT